MQTSRQYTDSILIEVSIVVCQYHLANKNIIIRIPLPLFSFTNDPLRYLHGFTDRPKM